MTRQLFSLSALAKKYGGEKRLATWAREGLLLPTTVTVKGRGLYTDADYFAAEKAAKRAQESKRFMQSITKGGAVPEPRNTMVVKRVKDLHKLLFS